PLHPPGALTQRHGFGLRHGEPSREPDFPVPPAARREPGGLVPVGPGGARARAARRQADPALGRLLGLPLVPRHGARELRGPGSGGGDEPAFRQRQGGPRRATGPRSDLPERAPDARAAPGRLAAHHVPVADGTPFFGGTYFPKAARFGLPGFPELCERIAAIWRDKQPDIARQNSEVQKALARTLPRRAARRPELSRDLLRAVLDNLRASFDPRFGGFGAAPKFPHPTDLELCLRKGETDIAHTTLKRMCEGGIYDQLGGGFSRYSVDAQWMIPHFEKMLYDNGPLLALLADAWLVT